VGHQQVGAKAKLGHHQMRTARLPLYLPLTASLQAEVVTFALTALMQIHEPVTDQFVLHPPLIFLERSGDHMPRSAPPQSIERAEKNLHNPLPPPRARKPYYVTCKPLRSQSDEIVASHMSTSTRRRPGWETGLARKAVAENLVQSGYGGTDGRTGEDDCGTATANPRLAIHCHSLP